MKLKEMSYEERKELHAKLENWLGMYTEEAIIRVMSRIEEIVENDFTMKLINELNEREAKEKEDRMMALSSMIADVEKNRTIEGHCVHLHTLTHAKSYRDILFDMYVRD